MIKHRDYFANMVKMTSFAFFRFEKLISFDIKILELYIEKDQFNELKGVTYGMGCAWGIIYIAY